MFIAKQVGLANLTLLGSSRGWCRVHMLKTRAFFTYPSLCFQRVLISIIFFSFCGIETDVECRGKAGPSGHIIAGHQKWGSIPESSEFKVNMETNRESHSTRHHQPEI